MLYCHAAVQHVSLCPIKSGTLFRQMLTDFQNYYTILSLERERNLQNNSNEK